MGTVYVKPIEGALVRTPGTMTPLAKEGALVSLDGDEGTFWRRRIADGSVVVVEQPVVIDTTVVQAENTTLSIDESAKSDRQRRRV